MFFKKKKDSLKIQDISSACPDYTVAEKEREKTVQEEQKELPAAPGKDRRKRKKEKKQEKQRIQSTRTRRKSPVVRVITCLGVLLVAGLLVYYVVLPVLVGNHSVSVERISNIMGLGSGNGTLNRYAGIVESQDEWTVKAEGGQSVKEVYVKEGDNVSLGDPLFSYDKEEIQLNLSQAKLELKQIEADISAAKSQISSLENLKDNASSSDQLEYEVQIQSLKANQKKLEYDQKNQQAVIESLEKSAENAVVKSELAGVVKKIDSSVLSGGTGEDTDFISILATGDYRIKSMVNEQNQWTLEEGAAVIVRSRVDESMTWTGKIVTIDLDDVQKKDSSYGEDGNLTSSSSYPFYIKLDSSEGLLLGQHVYVELDQGQEQKRDGVWLEGYYLVQEGDKTYVWTENIFHLLEKREVTLGQFDEALGKYEILSGLTQEDYIAFPTEDLHMWMRTTKESESQQEGTASEGQQDEFQMEDDSFQNFDANEKNDPDDSQDGSSAEDGGDDLGPVGKLGEDQEVLL